MKTVAVVALLLWIILFSAVIEHKFNTGGKDGVRFLSRTGKGGWIQAVVLGVLIGLANYYGSTFPIPAFIVTAVVMLWIAQWYWCNAGSWGDFFLFLFLTIPIGFVLLQAGTGIAGGCESAFWYSFWTVLSNVLVTLFGALLILVLCLRKMAAGKRRLYGVLAIIFAALTLLHVIFQIVWGINWGGAWGASKPKPDAPAFKPVATEEPRDWWHFYNTEMLADEDPRNDYHFGPEVLIRIVESKIQRGELGLEDIAGKAIDEMVALVTPEEVEADFLERVENDPALGAAVIAWFDAKLGTRYLGEFYESCKEDWAATINAAKVAWMADKEGYYRTLAAWKAFLSTASSVEVVRVDGGFEDQMYMNPYTVDLVPDVIVMETDGQSGYFLRYTYVEIKETTVDYWIDRGYPPVNVAKLMGITPQSNPNKPAPPAQSNNPPVEPKEDEPEEVEPEGKASGGDPGKVSGGYGYIPGYFGGGGGGNITPTPSNPKDTNKGLPKEEVGNDVPSPGPDTNNGVGAMDSEAEKPTNTSPRMAEEQYADALKELITREEHQLTAGDPSTPTTATPEGTDLVKNADSNEFGGIDAVTPRDDTHLEGTLEGTNLGGTSVRDDPLGDEMDCPD